MTDPIDRALDAGRRTLTEAETKEVLAGAGVAVPDFQVVADPDAAAAAAEAIGYPVVVKVSSPAVGHKSEWGGGTGVALGLTDPDGVRVAARDILAAGAAGDAEVEVEVLVESAIDTTLGTELIVGGTRSDSFGPTILLGLGGVLTEVLDDTTHRLAPITESEVRVALDELSGADLLRGYRDRLPVDVDALAGAVVAVGDLLVDRPPVREIDVNPILAGPEGAIVLDAMMVVEP